MATAYSEQEVSIFKQLKTCASVCKIYLAQLNFRGPWKNIITLWQYMLLKLNYAILKPNLTWPF